MVETRIRRICSWYRVYTGRENIDADVLENSPNNRNQETKNESTYTTQTMSELYNTKELTNGTFPIAFKLIDRYHKE